MGYNKVKATLRHGARKLALLSTQTMYDFGTKEVTPVGSVTES